MRLREKGKSDGEPVSMGWDEAQAALRAGTHEVADAEETGPEKPREGDGDAGGGGDQGDGGGDAKTKADSSKAPRAPR